MGGYSMEYQRKLSLKWHHTRHNKIVSNTNNTNFARQQNKMYVTLLWECDTLTLQVPTLQSK